MQPTETESVEIEKFWVIKVLIHNQVFITNFFSVQYVHFYPIYCFRNQRSDFIALRHNVSYDIKQTCKTNKNMNNQMVLREGLFTSIKDPFVW